MRGEAGLDFKLPIGATGINGRVAVSAEGSRISESSTQHATGRNFSVSGEELKKFSDNLHKVEEYSKTSHAETNNTTAASHLAQMSTDLRQVRGASEQYSAHKSDSERLSRSASIVKQNGALIDADLTPGFVKFDVAKRGQAEAEQLFAGNDMQTLYNDAKEYVTKSGVADRVLSNYQQNTYNIDPDRKFKIGQANVDAKARGINASYEAQRQQNTLDTEAYKIGVNEQEFEKIKGDFGRGQEKINKSLLNTKDSGTKTYNSLNNEVIADIKTGKKKASTSPINVFVDAYSEFVENKGKKK